jgi:hypothetical protein
LHKVKNPLLLNIKQKLNFLLNNQWSRLYCRGNVEISNNGLTVKNPTNRSQNIMGTSIKSQILLGFAPYSKKGKLWHIFIDKQSPGRSIAIGIMLHYNYIFAIGPPLEKFAYILYFNDGQLSIKWDTKRIRCREYNAGDILSIYLDNNLITIEKNGKKIISFNLPERDRGCGGWNLVASLGPGSQMTLISEEEKAKIQKNRDNIMKNLEDINSKLIQFRNIRCLEYQRFKISKSNRKYQRFNKY